jgi:uncharacterized membrane protein
MANATLARTVGAVLAAVELGILLGPAPIRVAAGLILGLVLPGLVITRAVSARARIEGAEQLLLVPGISIAVAVIAGLVMNAARIHLTAVNWAVALGLVTTVGVVVIAMFEDGEVGRKPRGGRGRSQRAEFAREVRPPVVASAAMLAVAAMSVVGALVIGVLGQRDRGPGFTELWAVPGPTSASAVRLGVRSRERHEVRYRLRVSIDGRVVRSQRITLRPGQTWRSTQSVTKAGEQVHVALLKSTRGPVYRQVRLTGG